MSSTALATAFVNVVPSTKGMGKAIQSDLAGELAGTGERLGAELGDAGSKSFRSHFALAGIIGGIVATATQLAVNAMSNLASEAVKASDATDKFKKTLDFAGLDTATINKLTKDTRAYADATVYSLADIQGITAQLAANGVKDFDKLTEAVGNLNAIAGGNAETFGRVGLVLTQTAGAGKLTTENWNQLADAIPGASGKIQEALRMNGAFTGNFRDAMAQGQITAEEFNQALLQLGTDPIAVEAAKSTQTFEGAIGNLKAAIVGGLSDSLTAMKPLITGVVNALADGINAVNGFAKQIGDMFSAAGGGVAGFQAVLANIGNTITTWITSGGLAQAIGSIAASRAQFFQAILDALPGIIDAIVTFMPSIFQVIAELIPQLISQFTGIITQLAQTLSTGLPLIIGALATLLPQLVQQIAAMLPQIVQTLLAMIPTLLETALTVFQSLVQAIIEITPTLISTLVGMLPSLANSIISMLPGIIESAIQLFDGIVQGLVQVIPVLLVAILNALPDILKAIVSMLPAIIQGAIDLFIGLVLGLIKVLPDLLTTWFTDVVPAILDAVIEMLPELIDAAVILFVGIVTGISKALPQIIEAGKAIIPKLVDALIKLMPQLWDAGWQMISGLAKGLLDNIPKVLGGIVSSIGDTLIGGVKALFGIHSPSKVFYGFGEYMIAGLVNGLNKGTRQVQKAVDGIGSIVDGTFGANGSFSASASVIGVGAPNVARPMIDSAQMNSTGSANTVNYYAAPNASIDSEQALNIALKRAKVLAAW